MQRNYINQILLTLTLGLFSGAVKAKDVVVPVPINLSEYATFELRGEPGANQNKNYELNWCKLLPNGEILKDGCTRYKSSTLGTPITIATGVYEVWYSNTVIYIELKKGDNLKLDLQKIYVPKTERPIYFNVFTDYTSTEMQDLELKQLFHSPTNEKIADICKNPSRSNLAACKALQSDDYRDYKNTLIRFNLNDGSYSRWFYCTGNCESKNGEWGNSQFSWVVDPISGEFVSVLPGVYGILFEDRETGSRKFIHNIRVENN